MRSRKEQYKANGFALGNHSLFDFDDTQEEELMSPQTKTTKRADDTQEEELMSPQTKTTKRADDTQEEEEEESKWTDYLIIVLAFMGIVTVLILVFLLLLLRCSILHK